ncbi:MAG: DUF4143 domain-containing protein [Candidatus Delongbacteria bacterium]
MYCLVFFTISTDYCLEFFTDQDQIRFYASYVVYSKASDAKHDKIKEGLELLILAGLEFLKCLSPYETRDLYYWHRESASSNAEVDYVFSKKGKIVPVEVKAGTKGSMQSMNVFMTEKGCKSINGKLFGLR